MVDDVKAPLDYFKYAYSKLLPVFMNDVMDAGGDFEALYSATERLFEAVFELHNIPHSFTTSFVDYSGTKRKLDTQYFTSNIASREDFQAVLKSTTKYLRLNPVDTTSSITFSEMDDGEVDREKAPDSLLVVPIRTTTTTCGYIVVYYHESFDRRCIETPEMAFITKVMYLVALALQCEFNKAMLEHYLMSDHLTGLPNRDHIYEAIVYLIQTAEAFEHRFAILIIRVNGLKNINNSLGIITGDLLLKAMGVLVETAMSECEENDTLVGRLSGGDFIVLLTLPTKNNRESDEAIIKACCDAIIKETDKHVEINGYKLYPFANVGASIYPFHGETAEELLRKADLAKNEAKLHGPGTYRIYESYMDGDAEEILFLNSNLPTAISSNQFEMYYQAMIDVQTEKVIAAEALIRWRHPERGLLYPDSFMPFAEKNAYGVQIDLLVLNMACEQINAWKEKGINMVVSVNISPRHFMNGIIYDSVKKVLDKCGVDPSCLRVEILENVLLDDFNAMVRVINDLRTLGVGIALDDFGSGYSSLEYVAKLPMDYIKIDRSIMINIQENPENKIIMETILMLTKGMQVKTIVEGVERPEDFDFLREIDCDIAQGYLFNKPLDVESFEKFLSERELL